MLKLAGTLTYLLAGAPHATSLLARCWRAASRAAWTRIGEDPACCRPSIDSPTCSETQGAAPPALGRRRRRRRRVHGCRRALTPPARSGSARRSGRHAALDRREGAIPHRAHRRVLWRPAARFHVAAVHRQAAARTRTGCCGGATDDADARPWLALALGAGVVHGATTLAAWCPRQINTCNDAMSKTRDVSEVLRSVLLHYRNGA